MVLVALLLVLLFIVVIFFYMGMLLWMLFSPDYLLVIGCPAFSRRITWVG